MPALPPAELVPPPPPEAGALRLKSEDKMRLVCILITSCKAYFLKPAAATALVGPEVGLGLDAPTVVEDFCIWVFD